MASDNNTSGGTTGQQGTLPDPPQPANAFVNRFALIVTILSALVLIMLLVMAWFHIAAGTGTDDNKTFENIKTLFSILLPVVGTWMGTMLAFYFSKDNFEAANKQAQDLAKNISTDGNTKEPLVGEIMIKPNESVLQMADSPDAFKQMLLTDLNKKMDDSHSDRLPIIEKGSMKFIFLIYHSTIDRFIVAVASGTAKVNGQQVAPAAIPNLKMQDMYNSDFKLFKDILDLKSCFLPINATMDKVKQAMQDNAVCQDVFITQTGSSAEPVQGWITNLMVIQKAALFKKSS